MEGTEWKSDWWEYTEWERGRVKDIGGVAHGKKNVLIVTITFFLIFTYNPHSQTSFSASKQEARVVTMKGYK